MTLWRWTAFLAIAVVGIMLGFGAIPGMTACGGDDPMFLLEMVRSPAEVEALFPDHCRDLHIVAHRQALWLDIGLFVWIYSAFLACGVIAAGRHGDQMAKRLVLAGIGLIVIAASADQIENALLLRILDSLPGSQSTIDTLYLAPRIKFFALGIVTALTGLLHIRTAGWRKIAAAVAILGGLWSAMGVVVNHSWVLIGMTLGWVALAIIAMVNSFVPAPSSGDIPESDPA
ncbi:MAG: hypothetical protein J0M19_01535 [Sphingomonadales bacterium]|nr:hypothetical protein [Sphingomonadales bacterium]